MHAGARALARGVDVAGRRPGHGAGPRGDLAVDGGERLGGLEQHAVRADRALEQGRVRHPQPAGHASAQARSGQY